MVEANYCPNCNKLANSYLNKCAYCEGKTIKLHTENAFGTHILVVSLIAFVFFFVFITIGVFGNKFIDIIIGAFLTSFFLFGPIYYLWNKQKPILEALRKRGYQLYLDNKEEYEDDIDIIDPETPPPPTEFPWSIRNVHRLRIAVFIFAVLVPVSFLSTGYLISWLSSTSGILSSVMITMGLMMIAMVIHIIYAPAKRYSDLFKALKLKPDEVELNISSLGVKSRIHGNFDMKYDSEEGYYVRVALDTELSGLIQEEKIWNQPNLMSKVRGKTVKAKSKYLPMNPYQMESIKSLKYIRIEERHYGKVLLAVFDDKTFYSETKDIARVLRLLNEIKIMVEEDYSILPDN